MEVDSEIFTETLTMFVRRTYQRLLPLIRVQISENFFGAKRQKHFVGHGYGPAPHSIRAARIAGLHVEIGHGGKQAVLYAVNADIVASNGKHSTITVFRRFKAFKELAKKTDLKFRVALPSSQLRVKEDTRTDMALISQRAAAADSFLASFPFERAAGDAAFREFLDMDMPPGEMLLIRSVSDVVRNANKGIPIYGSHPESVITQLILVWALRQLSGAAEYEKALGGHRTKTCWEIIYSNVCRLWASTFDDLTMAIDLWEKSEHMILDSVLDAQSNAIAAVRNVFVGRNDSAYIASMGEFLKYFRDLFMFICTHFRREGMAASAALRSVFAAPMKEYQKALAEAKGAVYSLKHKVIAGLLELWKFVMYNKNTYPMKSYAHMFGLDITSFHLWFVALIDSVNIDAAFSLITLFLQKRANLLARSTTSAEERLRTFFDFWDEMAPDFGFDQDLGNNAAKALMDSLFIFTASPCGNGYLRARLDEVLATKKQVMVDAIGQFTSYFGKLCQARKMSEESILHASMTCWDNAMKFAVTQFRELCILPMLKHILTFSFGTRVGIETSVAARQLYDAHMAETKISANILSEVHFQNVFEEACMAYAQETISAGIRDWTSDFMGLIQNMDSYRNLTMEKSYFMADIMRLFRVPEKYHSFYDQYFTSIAPVSLCTSGPDSVIMPEEKGSGSALRDKLKHLAIRTKKHDSPEKNGGEEAKSVRRGTLGSRFAIRPSGHSQSPSSSSSSLTQTTPIEVSLPKRAEPPPVPTSSHPPLHPSNSPVQSRPAPERSAPTPPPKKELPAPPPKSRPLPKPAGSPIPPRKPVPSVPPSKAVPRPPLPPR